MLEITNPNESELETVVQFAFQHLAPHESAPQVGTIMQQHRAGQIDLHGIFQAKHAGTLVGAMYVQPRTDGSVMLWVPAMAQGFSAAPMFEHIVQYAKTKNAFAAIALADRNQTFDENTLCNEGRFRFLSDMINLAVEITPNDVATEPYRLQFVPLSDYTEDYPQEISGRLTCLVKETYEHTLDFPDLMQIAPVDLVLQGYKTNALFRPELWFVIRHEGAEVGVLLLTDASPEQFELTYMGLVVSVRRQGFSREIVRFARETASRWNRVLLLTSVDGNNIPACQSYIAQGFKAWDRKRVYARFFP